MNGSLIIVSVLSHRWLGKRKRHPVWRNHTCNLQKFLFGRPMVDTTLTWSYISKNMPIKKQKRNALVIIILFFIILGRVDLVQGPQNTQTYVHTTYMGKDTHTMEHCLWKVVVLQFIKWTKWTLTMACGHDDSTINIVLVLLLLLFTPVKQWWGAHLLSQGLELADGYTNGEGWQKWIMSLNTSVIQAWFPTSTSWDGGH